MPRRSLGHDGVPIRDARLLVRLGDAVDVGAESDDGLTGSVGPAGGPRRRHAGHAELDVETLLLEQARQIGLGLELLHPQLTEAEEHVDDLLDHLGALLDELEGLLLEILEARIGLRGDGVGREGEDRGAHGATDERTGHAGTSPDGVVQGSRPADAVDGRTRPRGRSDREVGPRSGACGRSESGGTIWAEGVGDDMPHPITAMSDGWRTRLPHRATRSLRRGRWLPVPP